MEEGEENVSHEFRHGFKTQAERLSMELRAELHLGVMDRLDPRSLAQHLAIPLADLRDLLANGASAAAVHHFRCVATEVVSAFTLVDGYKRLIVVNDAHAPTRQASDLAHELSHVVLEHEPHCGVFQNGCRLWDDNMEAEANWLGGALLVPRDGALHVARQGVHLDEAATHFGVSEQMMRWRLDHTGAAVQARREGAKMPRRRGPGRG